MTEILRLLRWILGTPVVALAFLLCFALQVLLIFTILGMLFVAYAYEDRAYGFFEPAVALAKVVYA